MGEEIGQTDRDLDALRERMRQLESFDEVIAESVRRARTLLDEASDLRDRARQELSDARAEINRDRAELVAIAHRILGDSSASALPPVPAVQESSKATYSPAAPGETARYNTIIVHGVLRPAIATGLRAHLMAQPGVTAVDPREFAEGILRLQVVSTVPIGEPLFSGWKDGEGLTVVQQAANVVEVVLPTA